ncbi:putative ABC transporter ATP-binding protein/permease [Nakaseomyces bracarensis]|uniref:ABC transporter ATP-binding protein/permease n=1 Tax=Nakaseomyces bracarensis TaxID=273131 RepID=A0ABR4NPC9_9SACH
MDETNVVENKLSFSKIPKVSLHVRDLSIIASKTDTVLVQPLSMDLPCGSVMAIMGGSGSGKTTLLNVLASKMSSGLKQVGEIAYVLDDGARDLSSKEEDVKEESYSINDTVKEDVTLAYVPQQDVLCARLTCRETLMYAADLKLNASKEEKLNIVNQLIDELGLKDCADTMVGDNAHRGLSGGEKRRLSMGTQMVSNPSVLFLDEPTTGLDAYSAYLVVKTLKKLAKEDGRTIILSIHQPRSDILFLFDYVCILSKGNAVYCDQMENMIPYFKSIEYNVPDMVNPADYFIDLSSVDGRTETNLEITKNRLDQLTEAWHAYEAAALSFKPVNYKNEIKIKSMTTKLPIWKQISVLTRRNYRLNFNDTNTLIATFAEPVIMGAIVGWIYYKPDTTDIGGLRTLLSCLYASVILQSYLYLLFDTYRLCEQDIALYDRECAEGSVSAISFIVARKLSLFITDDVMMTLLYTSITYFMFGLDKDGGKFFFQYAVNLLSQLICSALAMVSVAVSRDFSKASLVGNLSFTFFSMSCGFFVNSKHMPVYVRWTKYVAFTWYAFGSLMSNTFSNSYCNGGIGDECMGNQVVKQYGFPIKWRTLPMWILFCWLIGFTIVGIIILTWNKIDITLQNEVKSNKKKNKDISKEDTLEVATNDEKNDDYDSTSSERSTELKEKHQPSLTVTAQDVDLDVRYLKVFDRESKKFFTHETKRILQNVSATFKPGMINAIMGPSGSGKSSFLNLISKRLDSSAFVKFNTSGIIKLNDTPISQEMFKHLCSYVSQDDDHLLSMLTVRETFKFAAALRLHQVSQKERESKTDTLISILGLKHCENTIIGNEFVKGISGGEKRRVTMGIQLLSDRPILLLDEPTSGLDSFTSSTILEILENLCSKFNKTVILTIHQPRSELFLRFGNILLLAKSGRTAFNGSPTEMIHHFEKMGYTCPSFTNVADYFLDLISVNTQNEHNEINSKTRVENILSSWRSETLRLSTKKSIVEEEHTFESFQEEYGKYFAEPASLQLAYFVNLRRQYTTTVRNFDALMARIAQVPGLGGVFALYFAPLKHNYASISNRLGLAQESTSLYFIGMLANLAVYPSERDYFYEEFKDGIYGVAPFYLAYMTLELPLTTVAAIVYSTLTVFGCGMPRNAGNFFANIYCALMIVSCGEALGIMTNTLFKRPGFVVNVISVILSIGTQLSGLMSLHMSRVLKGINYINPVWYTSIIIINLAFPDNLKFTCKDGPKNPDGSCQLATGRDVLEAYGLHRNTRNFLGVIVCVTVVYRFLAYLMLKAKLEWLKW